jgi:hypothetical protein
MTERKEWQNEKDLHALFDELWDERKDEWEEAFRQQMTDNAEKMASDIAETLNGGEWKDGKWYADSHRKAWIDAVKPYADEIERLREILHFENRQHLEHAEIQHAEIERLREALNLIQVAIENYGNGGKSEGFALGYVDEVARAALKGDE